MAIGYDLHLRPLLLAVLRARLLDDAPCFLVDVGASGGIMRPFRADLLRVHRDKLAGWIRVNTMLDLLTPANGRLIRQPGHRIGRRRSSRKIVQKILRISCSTP